MNVSVFSVRQKTQQLAKKWNVFVGTMGLMALSFGFAVPAPAIAAVNNPSPSAKVSFTFDDGLASAYTQAAPTLAKYGLTGTNYVITNCVGMTTTPNTCRANKQAPYMSWAQVQALQNTYGWEIGSHTVDHKCLASNTPPDCQASVLTAQQVANELANSKSALASHSIDAQDISTPYGDYNNAVLAQIAKVYATHRGFADQNNNVWPYNEYLLNNFQVQETATTVAQAKAKVDDAIANNYWLVLTFHDIQPMPSTDPDDYQYGTAELDQIAAYVKSKQDAGQIKSVNVKDGTVTSSTNLLPNSTFDNGIADGWSTDSPTTFTKDTANNGSYPSPTNSIKMVGAAADKHLFSPRVAVDANTTYMLKNFLNVQSIGSGSVAFYIDEYDANGNWVSGQYKTAENSPFVESMNFTYKPSSVQVSKAALQVIVTGGSNAVAYLDNTQWFPVQTSARTNLMVNGDFDHGIADGWLSDDATNIKADAANHGSPANPANAVSLTAGSGGNTHLFSPLTAVDANKTYDVSSWLDLQQLSSGEVGFYVDEYDASGNWISGQYKGGDHTTGTDTFGFTYTPSSSNVKKSSLQVIVVGNSSTHAYLDDVRWLAQ